MQIRSYQAGDELAQARIYNTAAGYLPGFKPAKPEEIARRIQGGDSDPQAMFYATEQEEVVAYAVFASNRRVSFPWALPGAEAVQERLLESMLSEMKTRGLRNAWTAYRADWLPVHDFLVAHGFVQNRSMINYISEISRLPTLDRLPSTRVVAKLHRSDLPRFAALAPSLFGEIDIHSLEQFFWENPFYSFPDHLLVLKDSEYGAFLGVASLVIDDRFADPTKIDSSMPCFRLGAFGTEGQRHKRVNGLFSCAFATENDADFLLAASLAVVPDGSRPTHLAAQAPSDAPTICAWYDRFFTRQGSFPILSRSLSR